MNVRVGSLVAVFFIVGASGLIAQVTGDRLLSAAKEPHNWLTYSGSVRRPASQPSCVRSMPRNVKNLEIKWILQAQVSGSWESSPLVVDGIMYLTQRPNDVVALDATTGRIFWVYKHAVAPDYKVVLRRQQSRPGDSRRHLVHGHARCASRRDRREERACAVEHDRGGIRAGGYSVSLAPLVVKDKVIIGVGGGEFGIRGFIAAYDAATGNEAWRFYTIPAPGEPGSRDLGRRRVEERRRRRCG